MRILSMTLSVSSFVTLLGGSAQAAEFQALKKGEWKVEVVESSLGPIASALKAQTICIDEKARTNSWEKRVKDELAKSKMDCDVKALKQDANSASYNVSCKGTEASAAKNMPSGSKVDGVMNVVRESDSSYFMDQDAKASGLALNPAALAKIPEAQRAAVAALLATQSNGIHIKMKQHYSFVKDRCGKEQKDAPKAKE